MLPYIRRHNPLITTRIEFSPASPPPVASIAARIEFSSDRLAYAEAARAGEGLEPRNTDAGGDGTLSGSDTDPPRNPGRVTRRNGRKIPKPVGEPGRPGSGGYCIETVLMQQHQWSEQTLSDVTEAVRAEAKRKLNITVSYRRQNAQELTGICEQMKTRWPFLKDYDGCWPVRSMLKLALKYGAEAARRTQTKETNKRLRAALRGTTPEIHD